MITAEQLKDVQQRTEALHRYLNIDQKQIEYEEEQLRTQAPDFWDDPKRAEAQMKKVKGIEKWLKDYKEVSTLTDELSLAVDFFKDEIVSEEEVDVLYNKAVKAIEALELRNMLRQEEDPMDAVLKINSGAGGTESQDWASMLERMYMRYAERKGFKVTLEEESPGEVAGIKSCTLYIEGEWAYGTLRTETGIHRLVRKSPFDSNARRHTSFTSVYVYPEVDDSIEIEINPADLSVDVFRASGAGGQHIQKTESAVRIHHIPTGIITICQDDRSQHRNREKAMQQLKAKLYELEMRKRMEEQTKLEESKSDIGWGHQIRSYVLDQSRVKDLRTNVETGNTGAVLDGDLDQFIEASLKNGVAAA